MRIVEASNGTPQGGEQLLLIWSYANGSELTNFTLNFTLGDNQMPILTQLAQIIYQLLKINNNSKKGI
ncbi:TPA: hypothetical protein ACIZUL_002026 [Streptococcus agalactiae]